MPNSPEAVVDGKKVHKQKGLKKVSNGRYSKHFVVALLFAIVGVTGFLFANAATTTSSLWSSSTVPKNITDSDAHSVELGTKFQSSKAGKVTGVKFYKGAQNTGTHTGTLWDSKGTKLATVTFTNETASGWQTANFPQPINIASGVTYVISYHAPNGHYSGDNSYFNTAHVNGILTAPANSSTSPNGVYAYSTTTTFPGSTYKASNYWVDVIVQTDLIGSTSAPAPPTVVNAVQSGSSAVFSWNVGTSSAPIAKYRLYKNNTYLKAVGGNIYSYTDTDVVGGNTYTYQVKTVDVNGVASVRSVTASVTINLSPPPTCPSGTTGTPPNCVPVNCPAGTTGTPPNCVTVTTTNCALNIAAKACWAANTGVPKAGGGRWTEAQILAGQSPLRHSVGDRMITTPGTVIDGEWIDGCVSVRASNVIIRNSLIRASNSCFGENAAVAAGSPEGAPRQTGLQIIDSEVDAGNTDDSYDYIGIGSANYSLLRVNAHGTTHTLWAGANVTVTDSFLHDPSTATHIRHNESIDMDSSSRVVVEHNWISSWNGVDQTQTGAVQDGGSWGPSHDNRITNNFLEGGVGVDLLVATGAYNTVVIGNRFSPHTSYGNQFTYDYQPNPGNSWLNNLNSETGAVVDP